MTTPTLNDLKTAIEVLEHFGLTDNWQLINRDKPAQIRATRTKMTPERVDMIWRLYKENMIHRAIAEGDSHG